MEYHRTMRSFIDTIIIYAIIWVNLVNTILEEKLRHNV